MFISTIQKWAIIAVVVTTIVGGVSGVVWWQVNKIDTLIAENAVLEQLSEDNAAAVELLYSQIQKQMDLNKELYSNMQKSEEKREEVIQVFREHELTYLATMKPD